MQQCQWWISRRVGEKITALYDFTTALLLISAILLPQINQNDTVSTRPEVSRKVQELFQPALPHWELDWILLKVHWSNLDFSKRDFLSTGKKTIIWQHFNTLKYLFIIFFFCQSFPFTDFLTKKLFCFVFAIVLDMCQVPSGIWKAIYGSKYWLFMINVSR